MAAPALRAFPAEQFARPTGKTPLSAGFHRILTEERQNSGFAVSATAPESCHNGSGLTPAGMPISKNPYRGEVPIVSP
jgi:hypothetical protein